MTAEAMQIIFHDITGLQNPFMTDMSFDPFNCTSVSHAVGHCIALLGASQ